MKSTIKLVISILGALVILVTAARAIATQRDIARVEQRMERIESRTVAARAEMAARIARLEKIHMEGHP